MRIFLPLLLITITSTLQAQDSTRVKFVVRGSDVYFIKIDGELQPTKNIHTISRGRHQIEIWSPKYEKFAGTLETGNLDSTHFLAVMKLDPAYLAHLQKIDDYSRHVFFKRNLPAVTFTVCAIATPVIHQWRLNAHEDFVKVRFLGYKEHESITRYHRINALYFTSIGLGVLSASVFTAFRRDIRNRNMPHFQQQNPFTLEYIDVSMNPVLHTPQAGIHIKF